MESYKYLIIGGGIAGVTAAETIRQKEPAATIAVVNDEPYALYSRVMLSKPNFFLGKIPFEQVWLKREDWFKKNNIAFMSGRTAVFLNTPEKTITLDDGSKISYQKLLVAVGVRTRPWGIPGSDKKGIHYLRTLDDGKAIMEGIKTAKRAVVIGGGFIGFEMADLLKLAGLETTLILRESYFWQPTLDEMSGRMIERALTDNGVKIIENMEAAEVMGGESVEAVVLKDGTKIPCEMIICGIGTTPPPIDWIKIAGVNINRGILANEYMETNIPDIFTAGDITEYKDLLLEENIQLGNWVNAHEQGRIAGLNMTGEKTPFKFVSFYTTQGMGISIAFVGDARSLPDRVIIPRGSADINSYARILIVGKELVGATMINRTKELTTLAKLIENNVDVSGKYAELGNPDFDLKQLLPK
jgi:nitrite reductase (NADH) large subunit